MKTRALAISFTLLGVTGTLLAADMRAAEAAQFAVESNKVFVWVYQQTNAYREAKSLHRLIISPSIAQVAQQYADHLAANNATGHNADGRTPEQRLQARGFRIGRAGTTEKGSWYCGWAENVYEIWTTPNVPTWQTAASEAMKWWKASPGHDGNLRSGTMTSIGVGAAGWNHGGKNYIKVVQLFVDDCRGTGPRPKSLGKRTG